MEGKIFYLTKEKLKDLKKELADLIVLERQKTVGVEAPKMLESEDVNPEFLSYHEDMEALRTRISDLGNIIEHHELIKNPPKDQQHLVGIGAKVTMDFDGKSDEFILTGTLEANPMAGKISTDSPVGMAILGRKVGDQITILSPQKMSYKIKNIKYEES